MQDEQDITIKQLYPDLSDQELKDAEENLERYLALALRVYDRIAATPETLAGFAELLNAGKPLPQDEPSPVSEQPLTEPPSAPTI
jgi:hypothetical protein